LRSSAATRDGALALGFIVARLAESAAGTAVYQERIVGLVAGGEGWGLIRGVG
jgi:hypothetical protein